MQEVGNESDTPVEERLGLHFDLTVPFSRYVVEHVNDITFPFKRWQMQKVWRGERPQEGRFREFTQADIDVVGNGVLPEHYEVDLPLVMIEALEALTIYGCPQVTVHANNRKISEGFYRAIGLERVEDVLRQIDKLDKLSSDEVRDLLMSQAGANEKQAQACLDLAAISASSTSALHSTFESLIECYQIDTDSDHYALAHEGLRTLSMIIDRAAVMRPGAVIADLRIARGLDYYTGSVYETFLDGAEQLGSICSGGRYDTLATLGNRTFPGVGMSIGLSRLVSYMLHTIKATANRTSPAAVLVAVWDEDHRDRSDQIASLLRSRGISCDVAPTAAKMGKQIKYADRLGIPYVWFPALDESDTETSETSQTRDEVRNIFTGEQNVADVQTWQPADEYVRQEVIVL